MLIASAIISGLGLGSMYGLLALGFHVTHAVSRTVNFAQGSTMMLGAVVCFTFWVTLGWPLTLAIVLALAACALWGVVVERVAVRPFVARGSNSWLIATVALGIVIDNVVLFTFGKDPRGMPPGVLTTGSFAVAGVRIQYIQALIPVIGLVVAAGLQAVFVTSRHGKALLAVVQNKDAARLMGIRVERVVEIAFALSGLLAGIAGILIAPLFTISSTMGTLFGIKAFAVAILGGIESAWGVVLAGLIYGLAEALITALLGSTYTQIVTFALVILALALRPNGLFGRAELRKYELAASRCGRDRHRRSLFPHRPGQQLPDLHHRPGRPDRDGRHRAQRAVGAQWPDLAWACGVLRNRRLRRRHPDDHLRMVVLAGARRQRCGLRIGRRAVGHPGAAGARSLPRHGDDRLRLCRRAERRRVAGPNRRMERPFRHTRSEPLRHRHRREGHRLPDRGAHRTGHVWFRAAQRQCLG